MFIIFLYKSLFSSLKLTKATHRSLLTQSYTEDSLTLTSSGYTSKLGCLGMRHADKGLTLIENIELELNIINNILYFPIIIEFKIFLSNIEIIGKLSTIFQRTSE